MLTYLFMVKTQYRTCQAQQRPGWPVQETIPHYFLCTSRHCTFGYETQTKCSVISKWIWNANTRPWFYSSVTYMREILKSEGSCIALWHFTKPLLLGFVDYWFRSWFKKALENSQLEVTKMYPSNIKAEIDRHTDVAFEIWTL